MGKRVFLSAALTLLLAAQLAAKEIREDFSSTKIGNLPYQWTVANTNKKDAGIWEVDKDKSLNLKYPRGFSKDSFNIFYTTRLFFKKGSILADVKPYEGSKNAGILWHLRDRNNYQFALVDSKNALLIVGDVKDRKVTKRLKKRVELKKGWQTLKAVFDANRTTIYLNGKKAALITNSLHEGGAGVISGGDTKALFDDITIRAYQDTL